MRRAVLLIGFAVLVGVAAGSLARRGPPLGEERDEHRSLPGSARAKPEPADVQATSRPPVRLPDTEPPPLGDGAQEVDERGLPVERPRDPRKPGEPGH